MVTGNINAFKKHPEDKSANDKIQNGRHISI